MGNSLLATTTPPSVWLVCVLGIAVVFVGLICIIGIIMLMNLIMSVIKPKKASELPQKNYSASPVAPIENRQEFLAAVVAAVAEENQTDISAVRVLSFKKL